MTTLSIDDSSASRIPWGHDARQITQDDPHVAPSEIAVGVVIGRASENFDFFVFAIASVLVFPAVFFPFLSDLHGTLCAFALVALAFVARPIGTVLFMALQRRLGREAKLTAALFLLGTATAGIAFLPAYDSLGMAAIMGLAACRVAQGLAMGGSWDGLPSLLAMSAPRQHRGWYAALGQLGAPLGFAMATALFALLYTSLTPEDFVSWGWRYPFYVAFAINVVALFARLRLVATHEYDRLLDSHELQPAPAREVIGQQGSTLLVGAFAALASYALFHIVTVFPLSWVHLFSTSSIAQFLWLELVGAALAALGILASGRLADRYGRRRMLGVLAALIAAFACVAPVLLGGNDLSQHAFVLLGFGLLGLSYGQAAGAVSADFAPTYRYTGAALTSDLAWLMGAAFAPLVALGLSARFGLGAVTAYLLSAAVATLCALAWNRRGRIRN